MTDRLTVPMLLRAEKLRLECGLSYNAIANVLALDYGVVVNKHTVRDNLIRRGVPKDMRRATDPQLRNLRAGVPC